MSDTRGSPINIIHVEEDANLRHVSWNQTFLDAVKDSFRLTHGKAVLYVNIKQDRFRLVVCFYGMAMLLLPPITDADRKLSLYLNVSKYLRKFSSGKYGKLHAFLDAQIKDTQVRIERRKKLAKKATKRRKK
jgi:hypothetical protein